MAGTEKILLLQRLLQSRMVRYGLLTVALLLLLFLGLQVASRYILQQWLLDNGADSVTIDRILLNPFTGQVVLDGVDIERSDELVYQDQTLHANLSMSSLFSRHAQLEQATIRDMLIDIHRDKDGALRIGSYRMSTEDKPQKDEEIAPWTFGAEEVHISNVVINFRQEALQLTLKIDRAVAKGINSGSGEEGSLSLSGSLNGAPLEFELSTFMLQPLSLSGNIRLADLALQEIAGLVLEQLQVEDGTAAIQGPFSLQVGDAGQPVISFDGTLELHNAVFSASTWKAAGDVAWKGEVTFRSLAEGRWKAELTGTLAGEALNFQGEEALQAKFGRLTTEGGLQIGYDQKMALSTDVAVELGKFSVGSTWGKAGGGALSWRGQVDLVAGGPGGGTRLSSDGKIALRDVLLAEGPTAGEGASEDEEALQAKFGRLTAEGGLQIESEGNVALATDLAVDLEDLSVGSAWGEADGGSLSWNGDVDLVTNDVTGGKLSSDGRIELRNFMFAGAPAAGAAAPDSEKALQAELSRLTAEGGLQIEYDDSLALSTDIAVNLGRTSVGGAWGESIGQELSWQGKMDVSTDNAAGATQVNSAGLIELRDLTLAMQHVRLSQARAVSQGKGKAVLDDGLSIAYDGATALSGTSVSMERGALSSGKATYRGMSGYAKEKDGQAEVAADGSLAVDNLELHLDERDLRYHQQRAELTADLTFRPEVSRFYSGEASLKLAEGELLQGGEVALSLESLAIDSLRGAVDGDMQTSLITGGPLAIYPGDLLPLELHLASTRIEDVSGTALEKFSAGRAVFESITLPSAGGNPLGLSAAHLELDDVATNGFTNITVQAATAEDFLLAATEQRTWAIAADGVSVRELVSDDLRSYLTAGAELRAAELSDGESGDLIVGLQSVAAQELAYDAEVRVTAERLTGRDAVILEDAANEGDPPLATLAAVDVAGLNWSAQQGTVIEEVTGGGLQAEYVNTEKEEEDGEAAEAEAGERAEEPGIPLRIGRVSLAGEDNLLQYSDPTLPRTFRTVVDISSLEVTGINLADVDDRLSYALQGMVDKFSPLEVSGSAAPLAEPRIWEHLLQLRGYPLANLSPYLINAIGMALTGGKLDLGQQLDIRGDTIDIDNDIALQDVETRVVNEQAYRSFSNRLPVSFDMALSMIRDDSGRIALSVPIEGKLADLDVSYTNIIVTALTNSITSTVQPLLAYSVLGPGGVLAYLGVELGRRLISTELPVLTYDKGQVELSEEQKSKLDEAGRSFEQWMERQEELVYYIYPKVVPGEAGATLQEQRERQELYNLGEKRAQRVRNYLLETFEIDSDQLLIFQPGINYEEDAKGTVGFMR